MGYRRLSTEVTSAIARVQSQAEAFSVPLLILHGSADRMVPPRGAGSSSPGCASPTGNSGNTPKRYHGLFADFDSQAVLSDVARWLDAHLPVPW